MMPTNEDDLVMCPSHINTNNNDEKDRHVNLDGRLSGVKTDDDVMTCFTTIMYDVAKKCTTIWAWARM